MAVTEERERATRPEDLSRFFMERANAGDVDGLVALYEPAAVLASPPGQLSTGLESIRRFFERMVAGNPAFNGEPQAPRRRPGAHLDPIRDRRGRSRRPTDRDERHRRGRPSPAGRHLALDHRPAQHPRLARRPTGAGRRAVAW